MLEPDLIIALGRAVLNVVRATRTRSKSSDDQAVPTHAKGVTRARGTESRSRKAWNLPPPSEALVGWATIIVALIAVVGAGVGIAHAFGMNLVEGSGRSASSSGQGAAQPGTTQQVGVTTLPRAPVNPSNACLSAPGPSAALAPRKADLTDQTVAVTIYARLSGTDYWARAIDPAGDARFDVLIAVRNLLQKPQTAVDVEVGFDSLKLVPGSVALHNANYPQGMSVDDSRVPGVIALGDARPRGYSFVCFSVDFRNNGDFTDVSATAGSASDPQSGSDELDVGGR